MNRNQLPFEQLDVFQAAVEFAARVHRLPIPRGYSHLGDQIRRASCSVVTNTAEAATEFAPVEKARIFRIALRSAGECFGIMRLMSELEKLDPGEEMEIRQVGVRVVMMLMKLAKPG